MFCPKCGNQVPDGRAFCGQCGTPVAQQAPQQPQPSYQPPYQPASQQPSGGNGIKDFFVRTKQKLDAKGVKPWMYIAAVGALVAVIVLIIVLCTGNSVNLKYEWGMEPGDFDRTEDVEKVSSKLYVVDDRYHDVDELVDLEISNDEVTYRFDKSMGLVGIEYSFTNKTRSALGILEEYYGDDYVEGDGDEIMWWIDDTIIIAYFGSSGGDITYVYVDYLEAEDPEFLEYFD